MDIKIIKNNVIAAIGDVSSTDIAICLKNFEVDPKDRETLEVLDRKNEALKFYVKDAKERYEDLDDKTINEIEEAIKSSAFVLLYDYEFSDKDYAKYFSYQELNSLFNFDEYSNEIRIQLYSKPWYIKEKTFKTK